MKKGVALTPQQKKTIWRRIEQIARVFGRDETQRAISSWLTTQRGLRRILRKRAALRAELRALSK